ncbi:hypothetical protein IB75_14220 [Nitrosococcus oceani C-27]|uniref:Uncharacterized protein n=1 Tax=Nitrosococcus oceani C-27 TaxID=314279 RepID=A0A0E2YYD7_9GAMM|nr:hypothetical protein IB75_14220 [Nitrosococcus oceani C-27]KFI21689.1 hypothetical protein HW44_13810 [Nitrosococcus oceani]
MRGGSRLRWNKISDKFNSMFNVAHQGSYLFKYLSLSLSRLQHASFYLIFPCALTIVPLKFAKILKKGMNISI